ncbi:ketosteroid isomerase-related protein [Pseudomonas sp. 5P_3.1_Bac2]|uniref:ketosteroid isomerase-related protein n=1 Tax=Pseudomonas sp. 5P_3.1_Bac2 TaxID=2971617 RepID=UPI0021C94BAA|nr:ketosteroid isomerase-related protein [Pseudomonas sp. 5P_3.1_Bac2]MCU1718831.1 ester cyclase [Pseudomonas sp. 5P_3.1_Bac2]
MPLQERKKLVLQHIALSWNKGRTALAEHLHSPDFIYKSAFVSQPLNSTGFAKLISEVRDAMPDIEVVVEECIAEGSKVVTWSTMIGTLSKPAFGLPASDKVLSIAAMAFWTFNPSNQIEEICTIFDMESLRAQLGLSAQTYAAKALP